MGWYVELVKAHPIWMAMVQFAILGTFGDIISKWIIKRKVFAPYKVPTLLLKMVEWAILAVGIKYAFVGIIGFVESLVQHNMLPQLNRLTWAFSISVTLNLQFGVFLVLFHRVLDNVVAREKNWDNLDKALLSLLWFWIPAHTITFTLPGHFRIGLAAVWSVALGIILGFYNRKKIVTP